MPEFLQLLPPDQARARLLSQLNIPVPRAEPLDAAQALDRVIAEDVFAPHPLPEFPRSTVDGYAVHSGDTFGAGDSQPAYLGLAGEVPMGSEPSFEIKRGQCALIHTGGMLPRGADSVVMLENTQAAAPDSGARSSGEIEVTRAVAEGENVVRLGEDVMPGQRVIRRGTRLRPAEIGGLMALGVTSITVAARPRVGLISSGDEVIPPNSAPRPGQVRDVNAYSLAALIAKSGGEPAHYGIVPDQLSGLKKTAARALEECDLVIITAGSSASTRDMTAQVIASLGPPGVLVHGINTRPGKPTILGSCAGKAVIGLPGNPVSALVNGYLFVAPVIEKLLGALPRPQASVSAHLTINLPSVAGREDWWPVKLSPGPGGQGQWIAEPIFGKSNLIFTLAAADGLLCIPADETGLPAGSQVVVMLI
jgi:molybdopterin molybdotransferase